jgi:hypothetical protein
MKRITVPDEELLQFVRAEPRTVQEIGHRFGIAWLTAEKAVLALRERTGLVSMKTLRKGSHAALKIVYATSTDSPASDLIRSQLAAQIKSARFKHHFDFMEVYQFAPSEKKRAALEHPKVTSEYTDEMLSFIAQAERTVLVFSGNASFVTARTAKHSFLGVIEKLLTRGVNVRIVCRVTLGSEKNLAKLKPLIAAYPLLLEVRHAYQPLRGFVVDEARAFMKDDERPDAYKDGELHEGMRIRYELWDASWTEWLASVFWNTWRTSIDAASRLRELEALR